VTDNIDDILRALPIERDFIHAVAIVHHHSMTARGAVVLWEDEGEFFAEFFNREGGTQIPRGFFAICNSMHAEAASDRYRDLCRRFWVGIPEGGRPYRELK